MTTINEATSAIYSRFETQFNTVTPFLFDNEDANTEIEPNESGEAWVRLVVRHIGSQQETLGQVGNRKYMRSGLILVQVFTPKNEGRKASDDLVEEIRDIYEGTNFGGVIVNNVVNREVGPQDDEYQVVVEAAFNYHQTR